MPPNLKLNFFAFRRDETLTLKGQADAPQAVYDFIGRLEHCDLFAGVKPGGVTTQAGLTKFELVATLKSAAGRQRRGMTLRRRERVLLVATASIVAVGGTYLAYRPLLQSYRQSGVTVQNQQRELARSRAIVRHLPEWERNYTELRARLGQQMESFQQMSDVLKKIEEVAAASGVIISTRKSMEERDRGAYRELPVQCRVEATTDSLVKFLFALRTGAGFVSVEKLDILSQPNSNVLRCDILIHALAGRVERPAA